MKKRYVILLMVLIPLQVFALSKEQAELWRQDLDFYVNEVKTKHINPFHTLSEREFDQRIETLKNQLSDLSEAQVETRLLGITASIGDGHSNYFMMSGPHQHYPLRFKYIEGVLRIIGASPRYRGLVGHELISINGIETPMLYQKLKGHLVGVDNQFSEKKRFEFYLTLEKLLVGLGIVTEGQSPVLTTKNENGPVTTEVAAVSMHEFSQVVSAYETTSSSVVLEDTGLDGIKFGIVDTDIMYFQFRHYPQFEAVIQQCESLQEKIRKSGARNFIIDFRGNQGGSFYVGLAFSSCLHGMSQFDWLKGPVILIDGHTFSAAMSNAVQFKQIFNATIIGEPSGGDPNQYSETYRFQLPNSQRRVSLSIRFYPFLFDETDAVYPDIEVHSSWEDIQAGKDVVLHKAVFHLKASAS